MNSLPIPKYTGETFNHICSKIMCQCGCEYCAKCYNGCPQCRNNVTIYKNAGTLNQTFVNDR